MRVRFYPITDGDDSHNVTRCAEKILFSGFNGSPNLSVMFKTESRTLLCFFPGIPAMIKLLCMTWGCSMAVKRGFSPCDRSLDSGFVHFYWCLAWNLARCLKPGPSLSWDSDLKSNFEITAQLFNWVLMTFILIIGICLSLIGFLVSTVTQIPPFCLGASTRLDIHYARLSCSSMIPTCFW